MLRNYFITALRNFKKNRSFTFLNILGLGIGLACCLFVLTIIQFENSFDNWHNKKDRIYRVVSHYFGDNRVSYSGSIPYPTGDAILRDLPHFEEVVQFHGPVRAKITVTDDTENLQIFRQDGILYTDENFFKVLDFEILRGAKGAVLNEPFKLFLTQAMASKYFGEVDPIGKTLRFNNKEHLEVVGIVADPPNNTNLPFKMIASLPTMRQEIPDVFKDNWGMTWAYSCYVLVPEGADKAELELQLDRAIDAYGDDEEDADKSLMQLQPLSEVHNDERYGDGQNYVTPSLTIWAFVLLGSLILGTACLNFINLSTAQAIRRSKEVGIRKVLGGLQYQLFWQFMIEIFAIVVVSLIFAFTLGQILISEFNNFLTIIEYNLSYQSSIIGWALGLSLIVTFLAGFYPALILSGYRPIEALNQRINVRKGSGNFNLRRVLVITQFAFTNLMLISTIIVAAQMNYVKSKDLGFDYDRVVTIDFRDTPMEKVRTIANEFRNQSFVAEVTLGKNAPQSPSNNWNNSYFIRGEEYIDGNNANMKFGTQNYLDFYHIPLVAGININETRINDSTFHGLVNEKLVESLGWETPEQALGQWLDMGYMEMKIIGVMKNFNVSSLHGKMRPAILMYDENQIEQVALRLRNRPSNTEITAIQSLYTTHFPDDLFEMTVLEDDIHESYFLEDILYNVVTFVAVLSVMLSMLGLYGLVSFMANKNAKNIGIRKVFGASINNILSIFAKEYSFLMLLAFAIAAPAAYFLMGLWIEEFAYRIDITMVYFVIGFLVSFVIAVVTVGYRSLRAATMNPVESLRYE